MEKLRGVVHITSPCDAHEDSNLESQ